YDLFWYDSVALRSRTFASSSSPPGEDPQLARRIYSLYALLGGRNRTFRSCRGARCQARKPSYTRNGPKGYGSPSRLMLTHGNKGYWEKADMCRIVIAGPTGARRDEDPLGDNDGRSSPAGSQ